jgi:hypothetical protein
MPFAASLGFHADEIESSDMDSLVQWKKKRRRIVSTGARSTERGHKESSLGQRVETERHIRMVVANRPSDRAKAVSSGGRHMMICSVSEASEQAVFGIIRGGLATFTREVS